MVDDDWENEESKDWDEGGGYDYEDGDIYVHYASYLHVQLVIQYYNQGHEGVF